MDSENILKQFFTTQNPLGDIAAIENQNDESAKLVFRSYFDSENSAHKELRLEPSMIVGRKGSGKTDTLLSYEFGENSRNKSFYPIVYFESYDAAAAISTVVNQITDTIYGNFPPPRVEEVASFWDGLFWITIFVEMLKDEELVDDEELNLIEKFTKSLLNSYELPSSPYSTIMETIVETRRAYSTSKYSASKIGFFSSHSRISYSGYTLSDAKMAALNLLRRNKKVALILFDSIESLELDQDDDRLAISGLLKAVGAFNDYGASAQFRCCIPAEAYFKLTDMSQNPLKDFKHVQFLHWKSSELFRLAAFRYLKFLDLYTDEEAGKIRQNWNDFRSRKDVIGFWGSILPTKVENTRKNRYEATLPYLTRHTQLLPRHILSVLNEILSRNIDETQSLFPQRVSEETVIQSVRTAEVKMVDQIIGSYKSVWPEAEAALETVLSHLGTNILSHSTLHRKFNQSGFKKISQGNIVEFSDFVRMLSELGAIGRLIEKTDNYAVAVFEYHEPSKLIFTSQDTLCIHPIFTERFRVIVRENLPEDYLPVYPLGTAPTNTDFS